MSEEQEKYTAQLLDERRRHADTIAAYEQLQASPAWATLLSLLESQEQMRVGEVLLSPLTSADAVYRQEFMKGEIAALRLVKNLPALAAEALRENNERITEELESLNERRE